MGASRTPRARAGRRSSAAQTTADVAASSERSADVRINGKHGRCAEQDRSRTLGDNPFATRRQLGVASSDGGTRARAGDGDGCTIIFRGL
jgi:hypothetical protein